MQALSVEDIFTGGSVQLPLDKEAAQTSHQPPANNYVHAVHLITI
jgi:hypothetical protein